MPKTKKEICREWQQKIKVAQNFREKNYDTNWKRWYSYFKSEFYPKVFKQQDRLIANYIFSLIKSQLPQLYYKNPNVIVTPKRPQDEPTAELVENVINYIWGEIDLKTEIKRCVLDALIYGVGWMKQGWWGKTEKVKNESGEVNVNIKKGEIFGYRVNPFDVVIDPEAKSVETAKFLGTRILRTMDELRANPNYDIHILNKIPATTAIKSEYLTVGEEQGVEGNRWTDRYKIWEIYSTIDNKIIVLSENIDEPLRYDDNPYEMEGFPLEMLGFTTDPESPYPISDLLALEPLQLELNKIRTMIARHMRRFNRKYLFDETQISKDAVEKMAHGEDGACIGVKGDPKLVIPLIDAPLQAEVYRMEAIVKEDLREGSGMSELYRSGTPMKGMGTATEAMIAQQGQKARIDDKLDSVRCFCKNIARKMVQLAKQYYNQERVIRIVGQDGEIKWTGFTKEDIQGEYDIDVEVASTAPLSDELRRMQALELYRLLSKEEMVNRRELVKEVLKSFHIRNLKRIMPEPKEIEPTPADLSLMGGEQPSPQGQSPLGGIPLSTPGRGAPIGEVDARRRLLTSGFGSLGGGHNLPGLSSERIGGG